MTEEERKEWQQIVKARRAFRLSLGVALMALLIVLRLMHGQT